MPLLIPDSPNDAQAVAEDGLRRFAARSDRFLSLRGGAASAELGRPHRVFTLGISDLISDASLDNARSVGWRYLVTSNLGVLQPAQPTAVAEVSELSGGHRFASFNQGWLGEATDKAIDTVLSMPSVTAGSFELRMLRIPAIKVDSLWLKSQDRSPDLIYAVGSDAPEIKACILYSAPDFMALAKEAAFRLQTDDNAPQSPKAVAR